MTRSALAIAHPSHELRMYGWLEREHPVVYVLTDGGGRLGEPRLSHTSALLERTGCTPGAVFGRLTDLALYDAILTGDVAMIEAITLELADDLIAREIDVVAGDAAESYSSAHDVWRMMIDAAIHIARNRGHAIDNLEFFVIAPPRAVAEPADGLRRVVLDDGEFARKMAAVRAYGPKLAADVDAALAGGKFHGVRHFSEPEAELSDRFAAAASAAGISAQLDGVDIEDFRTELLWRRREDAAPKRRPFFEIYGEELVRAGRYEKVIRREEHLRSLGDALEKLSSRA
jgi:hypothetical protein